MLHSLTENENGPPEADTIDSRIAYVASQKTRSIIAGIGRTEDVKLSPDNKRLAVVGFLDQKIYLFSIRITATAARTEIEILDCSIISSPRFRYPHGVTFLDNDHIVVCSRSGGVDVFELPLTESETHEHRLEPVCSINGRGYLFADVKTPGSVDAYRLSENRYRVLVCNNHWHFITSHVIDLKRRNGVRNEGILLEKSIKIPDGISISAGGASIAISNHVSGEVLVYRNVAGLSRDSEPDARLVGAVCPHGVRFTPDGRRILVADAASRYLHIFESESARWSGLYEPISSTRIIDRGMFETGRYAAREGGLKGVDVDASNSVVVTTHMHDVIAFHDLNALLRARGRIDASEVAELARQRDEGLERSQKDVLERRWTLGARFRYEADGFRDFGTRAFRRLRILTRVFAFYLANLFTKKPLTDPAGPVVSLTTHGQRLGLAYLAIESIAAGRRKPSRIILWLEEKPALENPPATLKRLQARGLEILLSDGYGPHTKYYPYLEATTTFERPLVTADDDILYPRDWLAVLIGAHEADPAVIHCHRVHRIGLNGRQLAPYNEWNPCNDDQPSHLNFITGAGGAIYPPGYLEFLKHQGSRFMQCCPHADDIWLTANAIRAGVKVAQARREYVSASFPGIPGSQAQALYKLNVEAGGNQRQLMQTLSDADIARLCAHRDSAVNGPRAAGMT
jgi:DNA-binding beta-propeller fold protein YncE